MYETPEELASLHDLLARSLCGSGEHLRSIVTEGERTLDAAQTSRVLAGMCTLSVATVTAAGEPLASGADGHLWQRAPHGALRQLAEQLG